jgi:hypothetical protein
LLLNASYLVQHAGLATAPVVRASRPLATVRTLLVSRIWVTGALLGYTGLALNTVALGLAPPSLVQSIVAAGLVVVALGAAWGRRRRPGPHEIVAIGLIVVALATLGIGTGGAPSGAPSAWALLAFAAVAAGAAWTIARRRHGETGPHRLGLAAGILYGATNVALAALLASGGAAGVVMVGLVAGATVTAGRFLLVSARTAVRPRHRRRHADDRGHECRRDPRRAARHARVTRRHSGARGAACRVLCARRARGAAGGTRAHPPRGARSGARNAHACCAAEKVLGGPGSGGVAPGH